MFHPEREIRRGPTWSQFEALGLINELPKYCGDVKPLGSAARIVKCSIPQPCMYNHLLQLPTKFYREREIRKCPTRSQFKALDLLYVFCKYLVNVWLTRIEKTIRE